MRGGWLVASIVMACAPRTAPPPAMHAGGPPSGAAPAIATAASATPPAPAAAASPSWEIAVLPIDENELFRSERRALREKLSAALAARLPTHRVLALADVDRKLSPVSKRGVRCAYEGEPLAARGSAQGWHTSELLHVGGVSDSQPELWVNLNYYRSLELTLSATFDQRLPVFARYERAFAELRERPDAGLLGGLAASFQPKGALEVGTLTLCQRRGFEDCSPNTRAFADRAKPMAACFAGSHQERAVLLFEGANRCEIENLHDPSGHAGKREACLCDALRQSAGARASSGRQRLVLDFEASEIAGKPRPELRVIEVTTNLRADLDWHTPERRGEGERPSPVNRLSVDNLDALPPALARCALPASSHLVAELSVNDAGQVEQARVLTGVPNNAGNACVESALRRAAFACTTDGRPAKLKLAIASP